MPTPSPCPPPLRACRQVPPIVAALVLLSITLGCAAQAPPADNADAAADTDTRRVEGIRIATWNIEHFNMFFDQLQMPVRSRERQELWDDEEDLLEIKLTLNMPSFDPDILVIQEAASQANLEHFNREWMGGKYAFVKAFKTNSPGQHVAIMVKGGFEVLEVREYADEVDPENDHYLARTKRSYGGGNPLFPRGPGFVRLRTPDGRTLWVGSTHIKSKGGDGPAIARWRVRQIQRFRGIVASLQDDTDRVVIAGDFNDTFGRDAVERKIGDDAIATMIEGRGKGRLFSPTHELAKNNPDLATYHGLLKPYDPVFIDHIFVTPAVHKQVKLTRVIDAPIAHVASDHLPVMLIVGNDSP